MPSKKTTAKQAKSHGHFGNNGLKGKPSNNKGKKRQEKVPRKSKLDMELQASTATDKDVESDGSDIEENLTHEPISAHMYRSEFVSAWCAKLRTSEINEPSPMREVLGHDPKIESNCIFAIGEEPSCATAVHLRTKIKVKGKLYHLPPVKREADRHIRAYHFWMYNSGLWTRADLAKMTKKSEETFNASHICGGTCLNHARPESNTVNQQRKPHHTKMIAALEKGDIERYLMERRDCKHSPKCFINPGPRNLTTIVHQGCADWDNLLRQCL